jgi:hypothetical protein
LDRDGVSLGGVVPEVVFTGILLLVIFNYLVFNLPVAPLKVGRRRIHASAPQGEVQVYLDIRVPVLNHDGVDHVASESSGLIRTKCFRRVPGGKGTQK